MTGRHLNKRQNLSTKTRNNESYLIRYDKGIIEVGKIKGEWQNRWVDTSPTWISFVFTTLVFTETLPPCGLIKVCRTVFLFSSSISVCIKGRLSYEFVFVSLFSHRQTLNPLQIKMGSTNHLFLFTFFILFSLTPVLIFLWNYIQYYLLFWYLGLNFNPRRPTDLIPFLILPEWLVFNPLRWGVKGFCCFTSEGIYVTLGKSLT